MCGAAMGATAVFLVVWGAMIAASFWEAYVEGRHYWDKGKLGWKLHAGSYVVLTAYHFFLFVVMFPLLLALPLVVAGFSRTLFGMLVSAYATGLVLEDFFWFVANPKFGLKKFNPREVVWYPWVRLGRFAMPAGYLVALFVAFASWATLWR